MSRRCETREMRADEAEPAKDELAAAVARLCRLEGEFILRSGSVASTYFDKYLFEADPNVLKAVAERSSLWCRPTLRSSLASNSAVCP
jgi:hypothetical protein